MIDRVTHSTVYCQPTRVTQGRTSGPVLLRERGAAAAQTGKALPSETPSQLRTRAAKAARLAARITGDLAEKAAGVDRRARTSGCVDRENQFGG